MRKDDREKDLKVEMMMRDKAEDEDDKEAQMGREKKDDRVWES